LFPILNKNSFPLDSLRVWDFDELAMLWIRKGKSIMANLDSYSLGDIVLVPILLRFEILEILEISVRMDPSSSLRPYHRLKVQLMDSIDEII